MEKGVEDIFDRDYELDFDEVLANMGTLDQKIDSVNTLKGIARGVGVKSTKGATIDVNSDYEGDVYTSKHFVYGTLIVTCWREFIRIKVEEQKKLDEEPNLQMSAEPDSLVSNLRVGRAIRT